MTYDRLFASCDAIISKTAIKKIKGKEKVSIIFKCY